MPKSETLIEFLKLAQEKESKQLKEYKSTTNPRAGSDKTKDLPKLYHLKPDAPKSQQYERNIFEVAHPEKVILTPAYDKLNALVENPNERQRVMINITQKPVNGQLTQHKYAQNDLMQSLVAIATDLDNQDNPLCTLADDCLNDLHKAALNWKDLLEDKAEDVKDVGEGASIGAVIGSIAGGLVGAFGGPVGIIGGASVGATLGGLLTSIFNTAPQAKNVAINAQEAKEQLGDVIKDFPNDPFLNKLEDALGHITTTANEYSAAVDQMHLITQQDPDIQKKTLEIGKAYQTEIQQLDRLVKIFLMNAKTGKYEEQENDMWAKVKAPFSIMFGGGVEDAVKAMEALERVMDTAVEGIKSTQKEALAAHTNIQEMAETPKPAAPKAEEKSVKDESGMFDEIEKGLKPFLGYEK